MKQSKNPVVKSQILVGSGKSARLAALAVKAKRISFPLNSKPLQSFAKGLNQQTKKALQQANDVVEARVSDILKAYPAGKKSTFFKLKYGVPLANLNGMAVKAVFKLLKIDLTKFKNFNLIENLNSKGEIPEDKEGSESD